MIVEKRVRLRAIDEGDLPLLMQWRNDPQTAPHFFHSGPLSPARQRRWFEAFLSRDDEEYWIGERCEGGVPLGTIGLARIDRRHRRAELGRVLVAPEHRRRGYAREMCRLAVEYAFEELDLRRVWLEVFADNEPAVRLYRELGFVEEGRLRQHVVQDGRARDVLVFGLLRRSPAG